MSVCSFTVRAKQSFACVSAFSLKDACFRQLSLDCDATSATAGALGFRWDAYGL